MVEGLLGAPRPLVAIDCFLAVRDYTAVSRPTISGGESPDRTAEFREAALEHLPTRSITTEEHDVNADVYGEVIVANLDTDSLGFEQWLTFLEEYARLVGITDLRKLSVGVDARIEAQHRLPRPFARSSIVVLHVIEIAMETSQRQLEEVANELTEGLPWIVETKIQPEDTVLLQLQGGVNDFVSRQSVELIEELEGHGISEEDVALLCEGVEAQESVE